MTLTPLHPDRRTPDPPRALSRRELLALDFALVEDEGDGLPYWIRVRRRAMACEFEITLSGEDARHLPAAREALDEIDRVEAALTLFRETSDLVRVNRSAGLEPVPVDEDLFGLLETCRALHARTGGAYDVTSTPL